jgi:hypothetical protein
MEHETYILFRVDGISGATEFVGRQDNMSLEEIRAARYDDITVVKLSGSTEIPVDAIMAVEVCNLHPPLD